MKKTGLFWICIFAIHVIYGQTTLAPGHARVILKVNEGNSGSQMLLDANANTYSTIVGTSQFVLSYRLFEYKIPADADRNPATTRKIVNDYGSVDIPAGVYDYFITVPNAATGSINLSFSGQGKGFYFEAGNVYEFSVLPYSSDVIYEVRTSEAPANPVDFRAINTSSSCTLQWTNPNRSLGGNELTSLSCLVILRDDQIVDAIDNPQPGATDSWTDYNPTNGNHTYSLYESNDAGKSFPVSLPVALSGIQTPPTTAQDASIITVNSPVSGLNLGNAETVSVTIKNQGTQTIRNVPVYFEINGKPTGSGVFSGDIPAGGEASFLFTQTANLSEARMSYIIKAYTALTEDENPANNAQVTSVNNYGDCRINTFPYNESFENELDFYCWTTCDRDGNYLWERLLGSLSQRETRLGRYAMRILNLSSEKQDHYLISPKINLPSTGVYALSFWSKFTTLGNAGKFSLWITENNDPNPDVADYRLLWSSQSRQEAVWEKTVILLDKYQGKDIHVAFRYEASGWAPIWYLDDLSVYRIPDKDVGVTTIDLPKSGARLSSGEQLKVKVQNFGFQDINDLSVHFQVNNENTVTETIHGTLAALQDTSFMFNTKVNLYTKGDYTINAYTGLNGDENAANDTATIKVSNYGECKISDFPYIQDFEDRSSLNCWTVIYPGPRNIPDIEGKDLGEPHGGEQFWRFISFYGNGSDDKNYEQYLITPELDSSEAKIFEFYYRPETPAGVPPEEYFCVGYSTTGKQISDFTWLDPVTATRREWTKYSNTIPADAKYIAVKYYKFKFFLHIDDFKIQILQPSIDVGVTQIVSPVRGAETPVPVTVTVKNFGGLPVYSMDIVYKFLDNEPVVEHYEDAVGIAPATSIQYTFSDAHKIDVSAFRDDYLLTAYTALTGDLDHSNDTASVSFIYRPNVRLYGYRYWDDLLYDQYIDAHSPVWFDSGNLSEVNEINQYRDDVNEITAAEYVNDTIYAFSTANGYPGNFIRLTSDWKEISKTEGQAVIWDMTYDYSSQTLYAITSNQLLKVNRVTGALTAVAAIRRFYTLACHVNGQLFGVDENGDFYSIDKKTGAATRVGTTGMNMTSAHQSMTFDHLGGRLFWAMPWEGQKENGRYDSRGLLCEIDPTMGNATVLGSIHGEGQARMAGLYIPYLHNQVNIKQLENKTVSVFPNPSYGEIHIAPLSENALVWILDISGRTIASYHSLNGRLDLHLNLSQGIYFIQIEENGKKTTGKLIIK
jgi:hypothetical protein